LGQEHYIDRKGALDGDDRLEGVQPSRIGALRTHRPTTHQNLGIGAQRRELGTPGIVFPRLLIHGARIEHAVAVNGDRRSGIVIGPYARMKATRENLDLPAAKPAVGVRNELSAVLDAKIVPTHALLPHPALNMADMLGDVLVDVMKGLFPA